MQTPSTLATIGLIGAAIRMRREALGLSQDRLAVLAGLSRATINGLETGAIKDLGFLRVARVLELIGLYLTLDSKSTEGKSPARTALSTAARTASVSYRVALPPSELAKALRTGKLPPAYRAHFATLLDEAPVPLIVRAVEEACMLPVPRSTWNNIAKWATEMQASRPIWV